MRSEETSGRLEPLLSTGLARLRWAAAAIAFSTVSTVVVLLAGGLGLGVTSAVATHRAGVVGDSVVGRSAYVPAAFLIAAVAVAFVGWAPRATAVAWVIVGGCFVIGYLGQLLSFPTWLRDLSPYTHVPRSPPKASAPGRPPCLLVRVPAHRRYRIRRAQRRDLG